MREIICILFIFISPAIFFLIISLIKKIVYKKKFKWWYKDQSILDDMGEWW